MKRLKKPSFWIIAGFVCTLMFGILYRLEALETLTNQQDQEIVPVNVYTETPKEGKISNWVVGEGTALAVRKRHLVFETTGKVAFIAYDTNGNILREGSTVRGPEKGETKGQLLARLDQRDISSGIIQSEAALSESRQSVIAAKGMVTQAKGALEIATSGLKRSQHLRENKLISMSHFEQSKAAFDSAQSALKNVRAELKAAQSRVKSMQAGLDRSHIGMENSAIFAPFDGVVARLNIAEGDIFNPVSIDFANPVTVLDTTCITVVDPHELEVTLNIPVYDGRHVKENQNAIVTWGGIDRLSRDPGQHQATLRGKVYSVSPVLNVGGRTVRIKVRIKQTNAVLSHGMFVSCMIETQTNENALLIHMNSILYRDGKPYVYVIENGHAVHRTIQTGFKEDNNVEVIHGISAGDAIITKGKYRLHEGIRVNPLIHSKA